MSTGLDRGLLIIIMHLQEIDEGKLLVDAAKVVGVDLFVWSGLESVTEATGGKYKLDDFESKAEITKYAKSSGIPLVVVQAGLYASVLTTMFKPEKQADGSFIVGVPFDPVKYVLPIIDVVPDYGLFVREAIESPKFGAGTEVLSCGELISFSNAITQLSESTYTAIFFLQCFTNKLSASHWKKCEVCCYQGRRFLKCLLWSSSYCRERLGFPSLTARIWMYVVFS